MDIKHQDTLTLDSVLLFFHLTPALWKVGDVIVLFLVRSAKWVDLDAVQHWARDRPSGW